MDLKESLSGPRVVLLTLLILYIGHGLGETTTVSSTAELRTALENAASKGGENTIVLKDGTYSISADGGGTFLYVSDKSGTLVLEAENSLSAILDGESVGRILKINAFEPLDLKIENLVFQNGKAASTEEGGDFGGAIKISADFQLSAFSISGSTFRNNSSPERGGAIYYWGENDSILSITKSLFDSNVSAEGGGDIHSCN